MVQQGSVGRLLLALRPDYPLENVVLPALLTHLVLSVLYGAIFVALLAFFRQVQAPPGLMLLYGALFGCALWVRKSCDS